MGTRRVIITRSRYHQPSQARERVESLHENNPRRILPTPPPSDGGVGGGLRAPGRGAGHAHAPMREEAVEEILAVAQKLTAKQRQELLDRLSLVNKMTRSADQDRDLDMWATAIHSALTDCVGDGDASAYGRLAVKQLLASTQNWRPVQEFMERSRLNELKVVERQSVYHMLATLLVDHAREISDHTGAPLGPKLVGNCAHGIAGVFDQAFPGYLRAGLAKIAARQLVRAA